MRVAGRTHERKKAEDKCPSSWLPLRCTLVSLALPPLCGSMSSVPCGGCGTDDRLCDRVTSGVAAVSDPAAACSRQHRGLPLSAPAPASASAPACLSQLAPCHLFLHPALQPSSTRHPRPGNPNGPGKLHTSLERRHGKVVTHSDRYAAPPSGLLRPRAPVEYYPRSHLFARRLASAHDALLISVKLLALPAIQVLPPRLPLFHPSPNTPTPPPGSAHHLPWHPDRRGQTPLDTKCLNSGV